MTTRRLSRALLRTLLVITAAGCAPKHTTPATPAAPSAGSSGGAPSTSGAAADTTALRRALDAIFLAPEYLHTTWGVRIDAVETGRTLYALNESKLLVPASSLKIVTLAVAAERLGWDYRFETRLATEARTRDGVLEGDLLVIGSGDPTIVRGERSWSPVFDVWAEALLAAGIRQIDGRIVGDDDAFEDVAFGVNWAWDDFPYDFSAPVGALQYNENAADLTIAPGVAPGVPARVELIDPASGLMLRNELRTGEPGTSLDVNFERFPGSTTLRVTGLVPIDQAPIQQVVAVENPTRYFVAALKRALVAHGITVNGDAVDVDEVAIDDRSARIVDTNLFTSLASHRSPPLSEIGTRLMKVSQNLYAETLWKRLTRGLGPATSGAARREVMAVLDGWGAQAGDYVIWDGSGLSRRDYVTPSLLVTVLRRMATDARHAQPFRDTLPIAGVDGTLDARMKGTPAEGNARAKTGSMSQVRSTSGYVDTITGERMVYVIMANGFDVPASRIDAAADRAIVAMASLTSPRPAPTTSAPPPRTPRHTPALPSR